MDLLHRFSIPFEFARGLGRIKLCISVLLLGLLAACGPAYVDPLQSVPRSSNQPDFLPGTNSTGIEISARFNSQSDAQARVNNINRVLHGGDFNYEKFTRLRQFVTPVIVLDGVVRNGKMQLQAPNFEGAAAGRGLSGRPSFLPVTPGEHKMEVWATDYYSGKRNLAYSGTHRFLEGTKVSVDMVLYGSDERIVVEGVPYDLSTNPSSKVRLEQLRGELKAIRNPSEACVSADFRAINAKVKDFKLSEATKDYDTIEKACLRALKTPVTDRHALYVLALGVVATGRDVLFAAQDASKGRRLASLQSGLANVQRYESQFGDREDYQKTVEVLKAAIRDL